MDKRALILQVETALRAQLEGSRRTAEDSRDAAAHVATEEEKRSDSRVALELGALAKGHARRSRQLQEELDALERLRPRPLTRRDPVQLGAIVEVEDDAEGRTFFLLPVAAGREITGPDGDGVLTVITASSPMGRAVMGRRVGETVEVQTGDEPREWPITYVG